MLLIAASILAARKLAQFDGGKKVPATVSAVADAVRWAEEIMKPADREMSSAHRSTEISLASGAKPPCSAAEMPREARSWSVGPVAHELTTNL